MTMTFLGVGTNHDLGTTTPVFHKARVEKNGPSISDIIISHLIKSEKLSRFWNSSCPEVCSTQKICNTLNLQQVRRLAEGFILSLGFGEGIPKSKESEKIR